MKLLAVVVVVLAGASVACSEPLPRQFAGNYHCFDEPWPVYTAVVTSSSGVEAQRFIQAEAETVCGINLVVRGALTATTLAEKAAQ